MGRGRAKAKQTKVARDLKYRTYQTDFSSLERELGVHHDPAELSADDYADYADRYTEEDELDDGADLEEDEAEDAREYGRRIG